MELELIRTYFTDGTNGNIIHANKHLCYSIELPWKENQHEISCIPEGRYELVKRHSEHLGWHLQIINVPQRYFILIHPANNALMELKGCIAPVSILSGSGMGLASRDALKILLDLVYPEFEKRAKVYLTISS